MSTLSIQAAPSTATGSVTSVNASGGTTGFTFSGGPITTSGTLTMAGVLIGANGGTGVANTGKTITLGGNLVTSGAFNTTLTVTADSNVTLPTTGTLATRAGAEALTNKSVNGVTLATGGSASLFLDQTGAYSAPGGGATGANPTASLGLTAVNGSASTFLRSDGAPALDVTISPTWTGSHTFLKTALATTPSSLVLLTNTTAAAAGAQQVSPAVQWTGQGWKTTATAASQTVDFRAYVLPVQGSANPTATWQLQQQVNAGGFSNVLTVDSAGNVTATGNIVLGATSFLQFSGNAGFIGAATNRISVVTSAGNVGFGIIMAAASMQIRSLDNSVAGSITVLNVIATGTLSVTSTSTLAGDVTLQGQLIVPKTVTAGGTTGNQTINKMSGTVNIAAAGTTVTVTNSLCTANSIIMGMVRTNDSTAQIKNIVAGSGSFVITMVSAVTAETSIGFLLTN